MLLYMSNAAFHLAGDGKVCVCVCEYVCVCVCGCCVYSVWLCIAWSAKCLLQTVCAKGRTSLFVPFSL